MFHEHLPTQYPANPAARDMFAGNAALIAEAFNVAHETGLTPRQLLDVLRTIANGDYDNAHDPKAAARIARAAIAEANELIQTRQARFASADALLDELEKNSRQ